jgi:hypothetical protein
MAEKKPNLHKTLLILLLVLTPPFWLLFTDEGARVSDTALLWMLGKQDIKIHLAELDSSFTAQDIRTVYAENEWQCGNSTTQFGNMLCTAQIGTFNGFPSHLATFYFRADRVTALKVIYRETYHDQMLGFLIGEFGQPDNVEAALAEGPDADQVLEWTLDRGIILLKKSLGQNDEPSMLWLSRQAPAA